MDERLKQLFSGDMRDLVHAYFKDLGGAPAVVAVLTSKPEVQGYMLASYESSTAALYNFLLLAHEAGLGTCWMTGPLWVEDEILEFLDRPAKVGLGRRPVRRRGAGFHAAQFRLPAPAAGRSLERIAAACGR